MSSNATYLYCIVKAATPPSLARVPGGLPGATRPALVSAGRSLRLVVAEVPLDTYGPGQLEAALRDMEWVGEVAIAHEGVVEHFARLHGVTVVPMKLFTMFSTLERAVDNVKAQQQEVTAVVARVRGCAEWGVRVTQRAAPVATARTSSRVDSGAAFLAAKKQARDDRRVALLASAEAAEDAFDLLAPIAQAVRRRDVEPEGAAAPPLLDAAFLVPTAALARFKTAARRAAAACAHAGAEMTLTGPWPPYNFVQLEERS